MKLKFFILFLISFAVFSTARAQAVENDSTPAHIRTITPVKPATNTTLTPPRGTDDKIIERYLSGDTTSAIQEARKDSLKRIYPRYPKLTDVAFAVNIGDPIARLLGQKYGGIDVSATLNMWNRFQPVFIFGMGRVKETPDGLNYTYSTPLSPYLKIGANYNFLFKKDPKYQLLAGVRLGFSSFKFDVTGINASDGGYWQGHQPMELTGNRSNAVWGEILAGIKVQLWKNIAMGWQIKWHALITEKKLDVGKPWYIPGFGDRQRRWAFGVNIYYTLPLSKHKWPKPETDTNPTDNGVNGNTKPKNQDHTQDNGSTPIPRPTK